MIGLFLSDNTYATVLDRATQSLPISLWRSLNEGLLFPLRRHYLTQILAQHLQDGQTVLDLGAAGGRLAARLQQTCRDRQQSITITGCDVRVPPETHIPVIAYNGRHIPMADQSVDVVLMVDMLHHTQDPQAMLTEAARVARHYVLVKDHYWNTAKDFTRLKCADYIGNQPYGIQLPYNFLTDANWMALIHAQGLSLDHCHKFRFNLMDPCKHILLRLGV
jgi:2-polyprenyl-3-methyl-5-hydroxy-6-metoxy-1,4-benzoquinol methylase